MAKGPKSKRRRFPLSAVLGAAEPDAQLVDGEVLLHAIVTVRGRRRLPKARWMYLNLILSRAEARRVGKQLLHPEG